MGLSGISGALSGAFGHARKGLSDVGLSLGLGLITAAAPQADAAIFDIGITGSNAAGDKFVLTGRTKETTTLVDTDPQADGAFYSNVFNTLSLAINDVDVMLTNADLTLSDGNLTNLAPFDVLSFAFKGNNETPFGTTGFLAQPEIFAGTDASEVSILDNITSNPNLIDTAAFFPNFDPFKVDEASADTVTGVSQVPIPAGLLLFISGVGVLAYVGRSSSSSSSSSSRRRVAPASPPPVTPA